MGVYVEVKLHDGTVLGTIEILRKETEVPSDNPALDVATYHYSYKLRGRDPDLRRWAYEGEVEHERCDWVWALIGKVLNDKDRER